MSRRTLSRPVVAAGLAALLAALLTALAVPAAQAFPLSSAGGRCGGFAGLRCQPGLACQMPPRSRGADLMGVCVPAGGYGGDPGPGPRPGACPRDFRPVCGRDGQTYPNPCVLRRNGVPMWHPGRC